MKSLAVALFICTLVLLRPYTMQGAGLWYFGDDQDYFAHASSIVFGQFPSYKKEYLTINPSYPQSSIGSGLLAIPFVWAFSWADKLSNPEIFIERTPQNIPGSWSEFGFIFASCFYFFIGCFLIYRAALYCVEERYAFLSVVLTVLCQGLPLFALRRPVFSHAAEFFLQSLFVFLLFKNLNSPRRGELQFKHCLMLGGASALIFLTRYNNIGFSLLWPIIIILSRGLSLRSIKTWGFLSFTGMVFAAMIAIFKIWPESQNKQHTYPWAKGMLLIHVSFSDLCHRLFHVFLGLDWGLVYTAPYILIGLVAMLIVKYPAKKYLLFLSFALLIDFYVMIIWGSQGGWYGYRYFIPSAVPLLVVPIAVLIREIENILHRKQTILWFMIVLPAALSMICFEGNNTSLDLYQSLEDFGHTDITNNLYQFHVWQTVLLNPGLFWDILCKGGANYLQFLIVHLCQKLGFLTNVFFRSYETFNPVEFSKVLILYILPFIVLRLFSKIFNKDGRS